MSFSSAINFKAGFVLIFLGCIIFSEQTASISFAGLEKKDAAVSLRSAESCRRGLEASKEKMNYRKNWMKCIHMFNETVKKFPATEEAAWALYRLGNLYTGLYGFSGKNSDLDSAINHFEDLLKSYPNHSLADDAQYLLGQIYFRHKNDFVQAYRTFLKVVVTFPEGDMETRARAMMEEVAVALGEQEAERPPAAEEHGGGGKALVAGIRYWSSPGYTRVVIDVDVPVRYKHDSLKADPGANKPQRIYVDIEKAHIKKDIDREIPIKDGLLQRARAALNNYDTVRVVLDLDSLNEYKIFHLYDPFRIVLDVQRPEEKTKQTSTIKTTANSSHQRAGKRRVALSRGPDSRLSLARQLGLGIKRVVIDPGHGGKDPGCYVGGGYYEKDLVLKAARVLAKKMKARFGFDVFLTRNKDIFLSLEQRTAIANMRKADLFISLHVNAHKDKRVSGIETYFLNMATDETAITVAARENATTEKNMSDLQVIINDLMLNNKINESSKLAHEVQRGLLSRLEKRYTKIKDLGVKQAPFYVLTGASMPAVLVEMGFMTNALERRRIATGEYHEHIAEGICNAVERYMRKTIEAIAGG
jgi:N-acetylmuramoyl-L-alanine amidase